MCVGGNMVSVAEVAAALRAVLAKLPGGKLTEAAGLLDEARQALGQATQGSNSQELQSAAAGLAESSQNVAAVQELLGRASSGLTAYLGTLGVAEPQPDAPRPAAGKAAASPANVPSKPDGQRLTREQAEAFQAAMPPPVVSNTGTKTHGRWLDEHGQAHEIVSGRDEDAAEAARLLREHGIPAKGELATTADVEQKLAARMVREGRKHVDVSLNNRPCKGPYGCDTLVPIILPEGYSMTVHAPKYRKTFTGGVKPWSR